MHLASCNVQGVHSQHRLSMKCSKSHTDLLQGFPDHPLRLPLVVGLHHVLDVVEDLGVLLMTHVLAGSVAAGLGAAVQGARRAPAGLLGLRGDRQLLGLLRGARGDGDLLAGAHRFHLRLWILWGGMETQEEF